MTRSNRSVWKIPYIHSLFLTEKFFKSIVFQTTIRNVTITNIFEHKVLKIYNGKIFKVRFMRPGTIGYRLGAFNTTKIFGRQIARSMALKAKRKKEDKKKK